jgi:hypothetical protein
VSGAKSEFAGKFEGKIEEPMELEFVSACGAGPFGRRGCDGTDQ